MRIGVMCPKGIICQYYNRYRWAASFFFGARIWLGTILCRFSINYFSGLGLKIRVRVWVRVRVMVRVWVRVRVGVRVSVVILKSIGSYYHRIEGDMNEMSVCA